jgi:hypothetical protein
MLNLDIERHNELPTHHFISTLIGGSFVNELNVDYKDTKWRDYA